MHIRILVKWTGSCWWFKWSWILTFLCVWCLTIAGHCCQHFYVFIHQDAKWSCAGWDIHKTHPDMGVKGGCYPAWALLSTACVLAMGCTYSEGGLFLICTESFCGQPVALVMCAFVASPSSAYHTGEGVPQGKECVLKVPHVIIS